VKTVRHEREKAVWKRATELWESSGKHGVPEDFWDNAVREIDDEFAEALSHPPIERVRPFVP
jgi:hypothetical protein